MTLNEVKELLSKIAAVDNRDLSELTAKAWYEVIGGISYQVADRALVLARQDPRINWLEPKHILGKSRDAIMELNQEQAKKSIPDEQRYNPSPPPENYAEIVSFYRELYKVAPWDPYTGNLPCSGAELDRRIQGSADRMGWSVPVPIWK